MGVTINLNKPLHRATYQSGRSRSQLTKPESTVYAALRLLTDVPTASATRGTDGRRPGPERRERKGNVTCMSRASSAGHPFVVAAWRSEARHYESLPDQTLTTTHLRPWPTSYNPTRNWDSIQVRLATLLNWPSGSAYLCRLHSPVCRLPIQTSPRYLPPPSILLGLSRDVSSKTTSKQSRHLVIVQSREMLRWKGAQHLSVLNARRLNVHGTIRRPPKSPRGKGHLKNFLTRA
jgi:hypothetical protein